MPARLHVDERQLAQDIGDHCRPVRGPGGQQRAVQHYRCLTIGSPHGVHQRAAQGALHLSLQSQVTGPAGLLNRAVPGRSSDAATTPACSRGRCAKQPAGVALPLTNPAATVT